MRTGPGRVLIAVYVIFTIAAGSRSTVQITDRFEQAPLAFSLSAAAAVIYLVATVSLVLAGRTSRRVAVVCLGTELAGVLAVGTVSLLWPGLFPEPTVWSHFGTGYLGIPVVLPVLGLLWLRRTRPGARED
ncbi:hypothetical protein [Allonocardiopsis opalescens]|uniref:hypothetical protein n=1 Tax=Allonocardiopsis opalescens TaxID=1144618 RepID=UPI000D049CBC|nr:hypothetical protein [Allonocardiopsis opalescens]